MKGHDWHHRPILKTVHEWTEQIWLWHNCFVSSENTDVPAPVVVYYLLLLRTQAVLKWNPVGRMFASHKWSWIFEFP